MTLARRLILLLVFALMLAFCSVFIVPEAIWPGEKDANLAGILLHYRLPKTLTSILAGMALAVSGFILQQLFRNKLAGPYILGVSSGASLAVALSIIGSHYLPILGHGLSLSLAGFAGAMAILLLVLAVSLRFGSAALILLFGVILGQISGALQSLLNYLAMPADLKYFTLWSMGSFSQVIDRDLLIFSLAVLGGLVWSWRLMPGLSVMVLGNDVAKTLGADPGRISTALIVCTGLLSGISTAYCGPIAFIGMAIPNATHLLFRTADFRVLLLTNALLGACMALLSDLISSVEIMHMHIPVNVSTALIGGPFILYILLKRRH